MNRMLIALAAALVWSAGAFWAGWEWRDRSADLAEARQATKAAGDQVAASEGARRDEHQAGQALADIGAKHEEDRKAAEAVPDAVVADLRAGVLRLRDDLATCHTDRLSSAAAGAFERDAPAQLRAEIAGAAVRIARDADDQLRACQAVVAADREAVQGRAATEAR
ncbi:lysis system i-spanin subunit Rz [Luteimonas sp. TWI662]|uniref:lysis system i-spanin subunit Rz n=1 Tax=Luteimonas sp. TWI662 TaxID=3136789 RepID=UPI0032095114